MVLPFALGSSCIQNGMQQHNDFLTTLHFQSLGRAKMETSIQVITIPKGGYDPAKELLHSSTCPSLWPDRTDHLTPRRFPRSAFPHLKDYRDA
jgi:hypothetical protein